MYDIEFTLINMYTCHDVATFFFVLFCALFRTNEVTGTEHCDKYFLRAEAGKVSLQHFDKEVVVTVACFLGPFDF